MRVDQFKRICTNIGRIQTGKVLPNRAILKNEEGKLTFTVFLSDGYYEESLVSEYAGSFSVSVASKDLLNIAKTSDSDVFYLKISGETLTFCSDLNYTLPFKYEEAPGFELYFTEYVKCSHLFFLKVLSKFSFCCHSSLNTKVSGINFLPAEGGTSLFSTDRVRAAKGFTSSFEIKTPFILPERVLNLVPLVFGAFNGFDLLRDSQGHHFIRFQSSIACMVSRVFASDASLVKFPDKNELIVYDLDAVKLKSYLKKIINFALKGSIVPVMFKSQSGGMLISSKGVSGSIPFCFGSEGEDTGTAFFLNARLLLDFLETYEGHQVCLGIYFRSENPVILIDENFSSLKRTYLLMPLDLKEPTW